MYKCIKGFSVAKNKAKSFVEEKYKIIQEGSLWSCPTEQYYNVLKSKNIKLISTKDQFNFINIPYKIFKKYFSKIGGEIIC